MASPDAESQSAAESDADSQAPQPEQVSKESNMSASSLSDVRMLIVDDDQASLTLYKFLFEDLGAQVVTCASASDGFSQIQQSSFDILLSDIEMPGMDGYELIRQVRNLPTEEGGDICALALTGYASDAYRRITLEAGFQAHIAKPIDVGQLVNKVVQLLKGESEAEATD